LDANEVKEEPSENEMMRVMSTEASIMKMLIYLKLDKKLVENRIKHHT
jgi:hypothetical protein